MLWGDCFVSKKPPLEILSKWLVRFGLPRDSQGTNGLGKYVRWDGGGDLGGSHAVNALFQKAGYAIEPVPPDSSASNGPGERPHRTIKNALRAMLSGAALEPKFWPHAFHHFLRLYNLVPHGSRSDSPYTLHTGKKPELAHLRVFGCRIFVAAFFIGHILSLQSLNDIIHSSSAMVCFRAAGSRPLLSSLSKFRC